MNVFDPRFHAWLSRETGIDPASLGNDFVARALAERHGCTVIVTGRETPPDGGEPWMALAEPGFKHYGLEQLRAATPEHPPKAIRAALQRLKRRRELRTALDEMAALGLPVHYRVCDVTDRAAVRALCDELGDSLRMVIHNAGVDRPVRLIQKRAEDFADTVRTKVLGFANLCDAVRARPRLVQFCNVGSLTGRWGGMTGETDYAAANEALARLGLWAARHAFSPACGVKTLVWPTWEGVGMITNFAVTQRYVSPMNVDEGVRHWLRELAAPGSGEVMFMGAVGRAPTHVQIMGFVPIRELPNIGELVTRRHHVGEPVRFRPFKRFESRYAIDPAVAPYAHAFRFNGRAVLPAVVTDRVQPGACFAPMHWNDVYGDDLCVNAVTNDAVDPVSLQPELKFCAVALARVDLLAFVQIAHRADEARDRAHLRIARAQRRDLGTHVEIVRLHPYRRHRRLLSRPSRAGRTRPRSLR